MIAPAASKAPILADVNVSVEKVRSVSFDNTPSSPTKTILPAVKPLATKVKPSTFPLELTTLAVTAPNVKLLETELAPEEPDEP